ncbi:MAG TPA: ABC transporter permease [Tissierellia bacterium]|nr:ABC transporter permease [Tissierellia bacterium]
MRLAFSIARRFLRASKGQTFLIALGIAIGVSVQIFIGSLIQGLQIDLINTTIGSQSQITITSRTEDKLIDDYERWQPVVAETDPSLRSVTPIAQGQALLVFDDENYSVLVRGLDFDSAEGIYQLSNRLVSGEMPSTELELLVGQDLAEEAGIKVGDLISFLTNVGQETTATVSGLFDLETASLNKTWVITDLASAQGLFDYDEKITAIEMQLEDVFAADTVAEALHSRLGDGLSVNHWKADNIALLSGLNGQSISSYMIQVFVMISVLLGIASVLAITVIQKSRQIGILKAMGIRDSKASLIFLFQGLLLGIAGAILGILLGLGLAYAFTRFALSPDGTPIVPLVIDPGFIALSALFAITVSTLAALIPARKSSQLNPIEVIRNG